MLNRIFKFLFWVSASYIVVSCIGILAIWAFRPDIKVVQTIPFIITFLVGSASAYILGGIVYAEKDKE